MIEAGWNERPRIDSTGLANAQPCLAIERADRMERTAEALREAVAQIPEGARCDCDDQLEILAAVESVAHRIVTGGLRDRRRSRMNRGVGQRSAAAACGGQARDVG